MTLAPLIARVLLSVVFLVACLAKLADLAGSRAALRDFGVPTALLSPLGCSYPWPNWRWRWPRRSRWWRRWGKCCQRLVCS
jgi:hypothetical protein